MSDPAAAAESLGQEIVSDAKAFIQSVETTVVDDAEAAYAWLKTEYAKLEPVVLADLKAAVSAAYQEAIAGGSTSGSIIADVLTVLARDGQAILAAVSSDVISATVGLTTAKPAA